MNEHSDTFSPGQVYLRGPSPGARLLHVDTSTSISATSSRCNELSDAAASHCGVSVLAVANEWTSSTRCSPLNPQLWELHLFFCCFFFSWKSKSLNFQQMARDKRRRGRRADRRAFHSPALNKHSNTSVKSNNFTINEIPICLQCISRWHFPHCNSALIKFLKCKNASKRLKTIPGVSVPGRGLWYLIFIAACPGHWKPEC